LGDVEENRRMRRMEVHALIILKIIIIIRVHFKREWWVRSANWPSLFCGLIKIITTASFEEFLF
jgi:hypothetical protein